jgi:hypothetical protein
VNGPGLAKELDENKINYSGYFESQLLSTILSWVVPIGIFFLIWRYAMKKRNLLTRSGIAQPVPAKYSPYWRSPSGAPAPAEVAELDGFRGFSRRHGLGN